MKEPARTSKTAVRKPSGETSRQTKRTAKTSRTSKSSVHELSEKSSRRTRSATKASKQSINAVREVLILGISGSGKTTFLTVLGHRFEETSVFGLGMTAARGTDTYRFVGEMWHQMTAPLHQRAFPAATDPTSEAAYISWDVNAGITPLFRLSTLDCGGETVYRVFADSDETAEDGPQETQLRQLADNASVICLFVRPSDLETGSAKHPDASDRERERSRKTVETLLAVSREDVDEDKKLVFVLADSLSYDEDIKRAGGPKAWLFSEVPQLQRERRAASASVIATSAVVETIPSETGGVVPADNFSSEGLETFLLSVGGLVCDALKPMSDAILSLQDSEIAYAEVLDYPSKERPLFERKAKCDDYRDAGRRFELAAKTLLEKFSAGPAVRQKTELFVADRIHGSKLAANLESVLESSLRTLAASNSTEAELPAQWFSFRTKILEEAALAAGKVDSYPERTLPSADWWFEAALSDVKVQIESEKAVHHSNFLNNAKSTFLAVIGAVAKAMHRLRDNARSIFLAVIDAVAKAMHRLKYPENPRSTFLAIFVAGVMVKLLSQNSNDKSRIAAEQMRMRTATEAAIKALDAGQYEEFLTNRVAADRKDARILHGMGEYCNRVKKDPHEAADWYFAAAEKGNVDSQIALGNYFKFKGGDNPSKAIEWYQKAVENGVDDGSIFTRIGDCYRYLENRQESDLWYKRAFDWYMKRAKGGDANSMAYVGFMGYGIGHGVKENFGEAVNWLKMAIDKGNNSAWFLLGVVYQRHHDLDNAEDCFKRLSDASTTKRLSEVQATKAAIKAFEGKKWTDGLRLASKGDQLDPTLNTWLGSAYHNGRGVAKDDNTALEFWKKAAAADNQYAFYNSGMAYKFGWGTTKDLVEAEEWMHKAESAGFSEATELLKEIRTEIEREKATK